MLYSGATIVTMALYRAIIVYVILCFPKLSRSWYPTQFHNRMRFLMREHHEDAARRIENINYIRFIYEESSYYEMGYLMGEIIERYRKMVENLKKPVMYKAGGVFATIKQISYIENLYFEIYHLVNMMHEIPRKYGFRNNMDKNPAAESAAFDANKQAIEAQLKLEKEERDREKEKKHKLKEMKKIRELALLGEKHTTVTPKPKNKFWPIDYGWEIDYYWR